MKEGQRLFLRQFGFRKYSPRKDYAQCEIGIRDNVLSFQLSRGSAPQKRMQIIQLFDFQLQCFRNSDYHISFQCKRHRLIEPIPYS